MGFSPSLMLSPFFQLAGVTRIELASAVLETVALPLCYTPNKGITFRNYKPRTIWLTSDMSTFPAKLALKCFITDGIDLSSSLLISSRISSLDN